MASHFLDLPRELRYMIYDYTFPPRHITAPRTHTAARKYLLSLLQTSPDLHDEVAEAYYGSHTFRIVFAGSLDHNLDARGAVRFQGLTVLYREIATTQVFAPLCRVKHLRICVQTPSHESAICEAQTVLYALVKRLTICGALHILEVGIDTATPPAGNRKGAIKPLFLPPDRITKFLVEPFRNLELSCVEQLARLTFLISGEEGQPLEALTSELLDDFQQWDAPALLDAWIRYIFVLKQLLQIAASITSSAASAILPGEIDGFIRHMSNARICSDLEMLKIWHPAVVTRVRHVASSTSRSVKGLGDVRERKQKLMKRTGALEAALKALVEAVAIDRERHVRGEDPDFESVDGDSSYDCSE